ncbi:MAG: HAD family hydrolase [Paracoccaceae bacterium]|nr:HAD family hydrolase [Paracoccaceae bacterium]
MTTPIRAVLFDKDGTLFDFSSTWDVWAGQLIADLAALHGVAQEHLAEVLDYDLSNAKFLPQSFVIAGTNLEVAKALTAVIPDVPLRQMERDLAMRAAHAPLAEAVPLLPLLAQLASWDLGLGVMTNDAEDSARAHLRAVGVEGMFDFIAGSDSGYGAKPDPGPLWAFASQVRLRADSVVMVGDSTHDLMAGRAAGMRTMGVLTGMATAEELAPLADVVVPDIGHLPDWIQRVSG